MAYEHDCLGEPLGAGGAHVVGVEHLEDAGPGDTGDEGYINHGQWAARQHQARDAPAQTVGKALVALHGEPGKIDGEDVDQHVTDDKDRH